MIDAPCAFRIAKIERAFALSANGIDALRLLSCFYLHCDGTACLPGSTGFLLRGFCLSNHNGDL